MNEALSSVQSVDGSKLALGRELGRGGEGAVHELPAQPGLVAKLYHEPPDAAKQRKLRLMADSIDSPLREYAAWPEDTLHLGANGPVIGFTMQRIEQRLPIHMLYSPAQRRESFPQARFDFLVFVARNIAAAFETLHAHGHVLGDVNQGNVLVGADSRVILIDCDSFQIRVGEETHRCKVGVAHFTPPELQSLASFEDATRTPNHDGFGLALLIFHLLMGGRHPYSGVPLADKVGESLEADIRDFRYAYATDAAQRLIAPPPKSVPIASLPPAIVALFEQAFTEGGATTRPSAQQWLIALDALRAQLKPCPKQSLHVHAAHLDSCPWCALDQRHVTLFGELSRPRTRDTPETNRALDLEAMEAEFAKTGWAEPVEMPQFATVQPAAATNFRIPLVWRVVPFAMFFGGLATQGLLPSWIVSPITFVGWAGIAITIAMSRGASGGVDQRYAEQRFRKLSEQLRQEVSSINAVNGTATVAQWRSAVRELRQHRASQGMPSGPGGRTERGLRAYLGTHRISQWQHSPVTPMQRVMLDAAGIETAADFDPTSLYRMEALDPAVRDRLITWRSDLVRSFRHQGAAVTSQAERELQQRVRARQRLLEAEVQSAFEKLRQTPPPRRAIAQSRMNALQGLKAETATAYSRWLETLK